MQASKETLEIQTRLSNLELSREWCKERERERQIVKQREDGYGQNEKQ